MKFRQIEPFEAHLRAAQMHCLPFVYGIMLNDFFEQKMIIAELVKKIRGKPIWLRESRASLENLIHRIDAPDLLISRRVFIYDGVDKLKEKSALISDTLRSLPPNTWVIFLSNALRFYELMEGKMILLDLSKETPRSRYLRIERWLISEVKKRGKSLTQQAKTHLLDRFMTNFECLMREVQKLAHYVGEKVEIDLKAVHAICRASQTQTASWEVAKAMIWERKSKESTFCPITMEKLLPFLGQLRYHLQLGLVITSCLQNKRDKEIARAYPKLSEKMLDRYKQLAHSFSPDYFKGGLKHLFALQLRMLERGMDPSAFMAQFTIYLKRSLTDE